MRFKFGVGRDDDKYDITERLAQEKVSWHDTSIAQSHANHVFNRFHDQTSSSRPPQFSPIFRMRLTDLVVTFCSLFM